MKKRWLRRGWRTRRISYAVSYTYRNMGVRIKVSKLEDEVSLDDAKDLAASVLSRLETAQFREGPVPTPTCGFEPLNAARDIYR